MTDVEITLGKQASAAGVDPARIGEGKKPAPDVAGQSVSMNANIYVCPQCWAMNDVALDPMRLSIYSCWNCGDFFDV